MYNNKDLCIYNECHIHCDSRNVVLIVVTMQTLYVNTSSQMNPNKSVFSSTMVKPVTTSQLIEENLLVFMEFFI